MRPKHRTGLKVEALVGGLDFSAGLGPEDADLVGDSLSSDRVVTGNHDDLPERMRVLRAEGQTSEKMTKR